jgi:transcriptional regulator with AAA-type ATPase domain
VTFLSDSERRLAQAVARLGYCNPFLPERIAYEREVLGAQFVEEGPVWSLRAGLDRQGENLQGIRRKVAPLVEKLRRRLKGGERPSDFDLMLYEDLTLFVLYHQYRDDFQSAIDQTLKTGSPPRLSFYDRFHQDATGYLDIPGLSIRSRDELPHLFACFYQLRRAFHQIFSYLVGVSMPAAKLRAAVWQSIFTHDLRRHRRVLYNRMGDIATLITGQTGTGKELVARAIGLSRYIPFDPSSFTFADDFRESFHALNLSALSPTLIESELFGHRRGAFTGAQADHAGWFEVCRPLGTVFLDEIGELEVSIQVKLLRVLQTRTFQRLGDTQGRHFSGKVVAATNRDLSADMESGHFRRDLYYRLCSDMILTPSLAEQVRHSPDELRNLVLFIARRLIEDGAEALAGEVVAWIGKYLGLDYGWPGNVRELEQCVCNVMIRREYRPQPSASGAARDVDPLMPWVRSMCSGELTAEEALRKYCTLVYARTGSYEAAARRLGLDRRTVKAKIDTELLGALRAK